MGLDWSSFALEVINFLILIWILTHYFYRPVATVIERRRQAIQTRLRDADDVQAKAATLQRQYETRLAEWEAEKRQQREVWISELTAEKARQMEAFHQTLAAERQQAEVLDQRRLRAREAELEQIALGLAGRFAAKMLERVAGPELEARLVDLFIDDLSGVSQDQWDLVGEAPGEALVCSAFPLDEGDRARLQQALAARMSRSLGFRFVVDPALIAGLRFELGPLSLGANVRDEMDFFRQAD